MLLLLTRNHFKMCYPRVNEKGRQATPESKWTRRRHIEHHKTPSVSPSRKPESALFANRYCYRKLNKTLYSVNVCMHANFIFEIHLNHFTI